MRIVLDLQSLQAASRNRGIGRYSLNLAEAVARRAREHEVVIALNGAFQDTIEPIRECFRDLVPPENIRVWSQLLPTAEIDEANRWRARASELVREHALYELGPDIVHATSLFEGFGDNAVTSVGRLRPEMPTAVTLYDLIPYLHAERYLADSLRKTWYLRKLRSLRAADLLLAISEHSRSEAIDALDLDPESVIAIPGDADARFRRRSLTDEATQLLLERHQLHRPSIMYTGGIDWRKNIEGLIEAYARLPQHLRETHQLAVVCQIQEVDRKRLLSLCQRVGLGRDDVVFTGYVTDEDLAGLYNLCKLFVFPSLHEGFGLPALEAMRCGAPVIGSDRASIPEVIGRSDALFDPISVEAISAKLAQALTDDGFRASLRDHGATQARKFSWDESARRTLEAFETLHARRRREPAVPVTRRRPRLAYLSPLPPDRSGIATYSAELLPELALYYDIELVTDLESLGDPWLDSNFLRRSTTWFAVHADSYDRVLYHFGNSSFHCEMFRLLRRFPGTVVLHDFFLSGLLHWMDATGQEAGLFQRALYGSHGWKALAKLASDGPNAAVWAYPCNWNILELAQGIIVHSRHGHELSKEWYGPDIGQEWQCVPALRGLPKHVDRIRARQAVELPEDAFVVCSFGIIGPSKQNHRLLSAWLNSSLRDRSNCHLIFVGEGDNAYERTLRREIKDSGCGDRIAITGYVTPEEYRHWLAAADVGVQLRGESRGETSRAVLDCLAYGLATIINAHGAMSELPKDGAMFIPDEFADADLTAALERLCADVDLRQALGRRASEYVREHHAPRVVARRYAEAIEQFASIHPLALRRRLVAELSSISESAPSGPPEIARLAESIAENTTSRSLRQILVDVSHIAELDVKTGIQRVTRAVLADLLEKPPPGYRIEPVYRPGNGERYHYARSFTEKFLALGAVGLEDAPVHVAPGDILLALDLDLRIAEHGHGFLRYHANRGLQVIFVVYDLLLARETRWFPREGRAVFEAWLRRSAEIAHGFTCISRATADDLIGWLATMGSMRRLNVGHFHLGADIENSRPSRGASEKTEAMLAPIEGRTCLLMVGTVEPRKGYGQALDAMERLWAQGENLALVAVGKQGWMVKPLVERMRRHPEAGRRLLWFESASDEVLEQLYRKASALLMASEGEGFGLPIIEAARHGLPVIARDLPVFREVAGEHAFYFSGTDGARLADGLQEWLTLYRRGQAPSVAGMPILTWAESTRQLLDVILGGKWYRTVTPEGAGDGGEVRSLVRPGDRQPAAVAANSDDQRLVAASSETL